jgi:hypothetical protein
VEVDLGEDWLSGEAIAEVGRQPYVRSVRRTDDGLMVVVEDADRDIPRLREHLAHGGPEHGRVAVHSIAPASPTPEQVFVELIARHGDTEDRLAA